MPGSIIIKPHKIDNRKIYKSYMDNYKKYGNPSFKEIAKEYILSLKEILSQAIKYRYEIYFVFVDGRDELKKRVPIKLFPQKNDPLTKRQKELYRLIEMEIFKKLSKTVQASKIEDQKVLWLNNYLAIPTDKPVVDYYVEENPSEIKYTYTEVGSYKPKTMYSRTHVVSSIEKLYADSQKSDDVVNSLQLESYPSDIIVKFDLEQTNEFKKNMTARKEKITKDEKRFYSMSDRKDQEMAKARTIAKVAEEVDPSIEGSKIKFQMFIRLRTKTKEMLDKRSESLRTKFDSKRIILTNEIGAQISLADNLLPYRVSFSKYINTTDLHFFARYNFLGGLYIGEENEEDGLITTYTVPGGIPIFHDISKPLEGKAKTSSPAVVFVGETGSGKSQQADSEAFQNMIFKGMKILTIDPKGDREKKIAFLKDNASHLKIGSKECPDGMFDPYLTSDSDSSAYNQAVRDIDSMMKALRLSIDTNFSAVQKAHDDMLEDYRNKKIKIKTLTYLVSEKLPRYDAFMAEQILTLKKDKMARLFFASEDTKIDLAFNLTKPYNLITFEEMPSNILSVQSEYDPNQLDNALFALVFSRVQKIVEGFMKRFGEEESIIVFDEYQVYKKTPGGEAVVDNVVRQSRTWQKHIFLITQELSSISASILNNVGEIFVGSLKSSQEIDYILKEMKLDDHSTIKGALIDRTQEEGVVESRKYNFLFQDYNNRKCLTKNKIPRVFFDVFSTLKEEKNVPVTGTNKGIKKSEGIIYDT